MFIGNVAVVSGSLGKPCSGAKYHELFAQCFEGIGEVKTAADGRAKFWVAWKAISVGYHVGSAGIAKYSAPFLTAIDDAFKVPVKK